MELRGVVALEGLEGRRLLAFVPVDTSDATYDLVIDGINTAATPISASSFTLGLSREITSSTGGSTKRDPAPPLGQPVAVMAQSGRFTTALMTAAFTGDVAAHATLIAHKAGNPSVEYERWTLDNARVTSYQTADNAGSGGTTFDTITLNYSALTVRVTPRDMAGQAGAAVTAGWDFAAAKAVGNVSSTGGQLFDPPLDLVLEFDGGQVPILSYAWGATGPSTPGGTGAGGSGASPAQAGQFSFTAVGGIATPALFDETAEGEGRRAILTSRDASGRIYSRWVLEDCLVSSYATGDASGDGSARTESFALDVRQLERAVYTYDSKGVVMTSQAGLDVVSGGAFTTGSLAPTTGFATLDAVSPDPRHTPVDSLTVRFPEKLNSTSAPDRFALFRDGRPVSLSGVTATTSDHVTWQINGLAGLTAQAGRYTFNVFAVDGGMATASGAAIVQGDSVSWTMDTTLPAVTATSAAPEGAAPLVVRVTFSDLVTGLAANDLALVPTSGASITPSAVAWDAGTRTAKFTFTGNLPDGNYTAMMAASAVTDSSGNPLAAGAAIPTFVLAGDVNRDRAVNFNDLLTLARNYNGTGRTWSQGDLTGDGLVNFSDLLILARAYNKTLAAPAEPVAAPVVAPVMASVSAESAAVLGTAAAKKPVFSTAPVAKPAPAKPAPAKPKAAARPRR